MTPTPIPTATSQPSEELTRLEILRCYKRHLLRGEVNVSPFTRDRVIRYHTNVADSDVPDIHQETRQLLEEAIRGIHEGNPSQVIILAGAAGMGKSHLINFFRSPQEAERLGFVFTCNSNHWKVDEFESCLLNWILNALVGPAPGRPDLLLEKIQDLAFQALHQVLQQPGEITQLKARGAAGFLRRLWARLARQDQAKFQQLVDQRDAKVFQLLDFPRFASYVCDRFLYERGNPFHRYVMHVLLRYLFEEDRELVRHWLRRVEVRREFLRKLGANDRIDSNYKILDTIKILISLFTPEVASGLGAGRSGTSRGRVFFFAFDQMEGRKELFDNESDWPKFFAQLSELYNALFNVLIVFTMSTHLREKLFSQMEAQFRQRIRRDQKFSLTEIPDREVLALYRQRVTGWLGDSFPDLREKIEKPEYHFLPFTQAQLLEMSRQRTLREKLECFDERFRQYLDEQVVEKDPPYDYLVARNQLREKEQAAEPFRYTGDHLARVKDVFDQGRQLILQGAAVELVETEWTITQDKLPALRLKFLDPKDASRWVRVFLVRLPYPFNQYRESCAALVANKRTRRNFLWLVRPKAIDADLEQLKEGQTTARVLATEAHTSLGAMLRLLGKKADYEPQDWARAEQLIWDEIKLTYLGEMLHQVREALERLQDKDDEEPPGEDDE